jgi:LacI family transcriptional regulator
MAEKTNGRRRRTLQDVAEAVGLSANTVSRALNDMPGVSAASRALIKMEAERIGYLPNVHARSLVLGSPRTIGVVVTDLTNPIFAEMVSEIESQAAASGSALMLLMSDDSPDLEQDAVDTALRSGVDGLIAVPVQGRSNPWVTVTRAGIPLVLVSREIPGFEVDVFSNDHEAGMRMGTDVLLELGARDVVLIEEDLPVSTIRHRIAGFRGALEDRGIDFDSHRIALIPSRRTSRAALQWRAADAYRVAIDLLQSGRRPEAFIVGNDYLALGLYSALREYGVRVPDDVLVMGGGDYPFSRYLDPPLSTLQLPTVEVARRAARRLQDKIDGVAEGGPVAEYIRPELLLRASTSR